MERQEFEDLNWINNYLDANIDPNKIKSALMFALLWNLFESKVCNKEFDIDLVRNAIKNYNINIEIFKDEIEFFKNRKVNYFGDDYIKNGLKATKSNEKPIRDFLDDKLANNDDKVVSLIWIIFRLRNNMFHGPKDICDIEYQEVNFLNANSVIKKFLQCLTNSL